MFNSRPNIIVKKNEDKHSSQNVKTNEVIMHISSPTNVLSPVFSPSSQSDSLSPQSVKEEQELKEITSIETRQLLSPPSQIQSPTLDESSDEKIEVKVFNQTDSPALPEFNHIKEKNLSSSIKSNSKPATESKNTSKVFNTIHYAANRLHENKIARNTVYFVNGIFGGISTPLSATGALGGVSVAPILIVGAALTGAYAMWQAASSYRTAKNLDDDIKSHKNFLANLGFDRDIEAKKAKKYAQQKRTKTSGVMTMVSNGTSYGSAMGTLSSLVAVPIYGIATLVGVGAMGGYLSKIGIDNTKHEAEYFENRIKTLQEEEQKTKNNEILNLKSEKVTLEQETNSLKIQLAKTTKEAIKEKQVLLEDLQLLKKESHAEIEKLEQIIATLKKEKEEKTPTTKNKETNTSTEKVEIARNMNSFTNQMSKEGQSQIALPVLSSNSSNSLTSTATVLQLSSNN